MTWSRPHSHGASAPIQLLCDLVRAAFLYVCLVSQKNVDSVRNETLQEGKGEHKSKIIEKKKKIMVKSQETNMRPTIWYLSPQERRMRFPKTDFTLELVSSLYLILTPN